MSTENERGDSLHPAGSARIRVYRQKGPGYWAVITHADGRREPVQSPQIYGFESAKEAREEAGRRCAPSDRTHGQTPHTTL